MTCVLNCRSVYGSQRVMSAVLVQKREKKETLCHEMHVVSGRRVCPSNLLPLYPFRSRVLCSSPESLHPELLTLKPFNSIYTYI